MTVATGLEVQSQVVEERYDLGGSAVLSLCDDFGNSCLVREYRELEVVFGLTS